MSIQNKTEPKGLKENNNKQGEPKTSNKTKKKSDRRSINLEKPSAKGYQERKAKTWNINKRRPSIAQIQPRTTRKTSKIKEYTKTKDQKTNKYETWQTANKK